MKEPSAVITTRWWVVFRMAWVNGHTLKAAKEAFAQKSYQHSGDIWVYLGRNGGELPRFVDGRQEPGLSRNLQG